ncbi:GAF domain-containing protein [Alteromonadaceae bacterium A_SAG4]|jgi:GAF domain-containing protein|nr:GAF domain-containing protein [Alteromonadaceae bacterium A_SAG4]NKX04515.1 GAF domain-containing protein [Alteromonadaceae bacterium A_SAG6]NKX34702.1 GAF domain-containing protein [Alteromonadaceae bacterium A_SAG3]NKX69832.1 GAF domain-containing protein [Alteromonadaceae bacterium A_SAG7]
MNHEYEKARIAALESLDILDTSPSEQLDELTKTVQEEFNAKTCLVSLVAEDRQWFKSRQCMDATETPRNISFCTYAIAEEEYLIVPDAQADKLFANNPLVTGSPYIRGYAGAILRNKDGYELGTLCLLFDEPRDFLDVEIESLKNHARTVEAIIFSEHLPA